MQLVNSFDVEPWWTSTPACIDPSEWGTMSDRSEAPMHAYLDLCDEAGVKSTFFFIGWYAKNFPAMVREVVARGHEIGCHSLTHEDIDTLTTAEFRENTIQAKAMIEDAAGIGIDAYRAPCFSFPPARTRELLSELVDLGFGLDSSITTAGRIHGGGHAKADFPKPQNLKASLGVDIFEVPVPGVKIGNRELTVFGGGYLRMAPRPVLNMLARNEAYQVLYLHPHDFDLDLPPLPRSGPVAQMRRKLHVGDLRRKLLDLFAASDVKTCGQLRDEHLISATTASAA
ncbi:MAG: polysaccharide deacetylase family protein [Brevundimonas sp.]